MTLLFGQGCSSNEFMVTSCLTTVKMELIPLIKVCCNTGDVEIITYPGFYAIQGSIFILLLEMGVFFMPDAPFDYTRRLAREEGIFVGISSGAAVAAVAKKIADLPPKSRILTFAYDTGERYLSIEGLF